MRAGSESNLLGKECSNRWQGRTEEVACSGLCRRASSCGAGKGRATRHGTVAHQIAEVVGAFGAEVERILVVTQVAARGRLRHCASAQGPSCAAPSMGDYSKRQVCSNLKAKFPPRDRVLSLDKKKL